MPVALTQQHGPAVVATGETTARGVPAPRISLPAVSVPTLLLFAGGLALGIVSTWLLLAGLVSPVVTVALNTLVTFAMYTVVHESAHHSAGKLTWVNELL